MPSLTSACHHQQYYTKPHPNAHQIKAPSFSLVSMGIREISHDAVAGSLPNNNTDDGGDSRRDLPLLSLNHVSYVCKSVKKSVEFYERVLGFVLIKRPSSFDFEGAWLFNHGVGIHLLQAENAPEKKGRINPKDNHISFQCTDMNMIINKLKEMEIEYATAIVKEGGIVVDQLFFHDPDGYMIEICNCQNLPVLPISSCPLKTMSNPNASLNKSSSFYGKTQCGGGVEAMMMENLAMDMMNLSI